MIIYTTKGFIILEPECQAEISQLEDIKNKCEIEDINYEERRQLSIYSLKIFVSSKDIK